MLFLSAQVSPVNAFLFPGPTRCGAIFFLFLAGSGLYQIRCLVKNPSAEALVICGLLFLSSYLFFSQILSELILYIAFALLIFGLSYERGFLARVLSSKLAVQGGLASYSLYMTHFLVLQAFIFYTWAYWKQLPQLTFARYFILLLAAGAFIGTAFFFYRCIEDARKQKTAPAF